MSGLRPWGINVFRQNRGAPMVSLGIHLDLHTPTVDIHLPRWLVQIGRNTYWTPGNGLRGMRFYCGGRVTIIDDGVRWSGHTDNCDHPR